MSDLYQITPEQKAIMRRRMDRDPWMFSKHVCGRDPKAERHHRPLLYLYTRKAELLCACLSSPRYDGPITQQVRADFAAHEIDWTNAEHLPRVKKRIRRINVRLPRTFGKSTFADDADLYDASIDPNITISIGSKSDPYAWSRISTIGEFIMSKEYAFWYPERVPLDPRHDVTQTSITLNGRSRHVPEATIEGRGLRSQWAGTHYRKNRRDDIVGTESGEASVEDALIHLANMSAMRDLTGWVGDTIIGTITGEEDDNSMLQADEGVLTIIVPIEKHEGGTTLSNVYAEGELMLPEWFDRETVDLVKQEARGNPQYGGIWLIQNYYMAAAYSAGSKIFPPELMARSVFIWHHDKTLKRRVILRPKRGKEDTPRIEKNGRWYPVRPEDWTVIDLAKLPRSAFAWAGDQSTSEFGNEWALCGVCMDWEGVIYILKNEKDHGYDKMLSRLIPFDKEMGSPIRNGLDAAATQGMTVDWLQRAPEFQRIARRVEQIRSNREAKDVNIRRWLQARFMTGETYINPELHALVRECLRYRPRKSDGSLNKRAVDDGMDAAWMASTLPRRPVPPEQMDEDSIIARADALAANRSRGPEAGGEDSWLDCIWSNNDVA